MKNKQEEVIGFRLEKVAFDRLPQTDEELSELEKQACEGETGARERLICSCIPYAWKYYVSQNCLNNGFYCRDDGLQNALLKLMTDALAKYDYRKGHLKSYMSKWLYGDVRRTSFDSAKGGLTNAPQKVSSDSDEEEDSKNLIVSFDTPVYDRKGNQTGTIEDFLSTEQRSLDDVLYKEELNAVIKTVLDAVLTGDERAAIEIRFGFRSDEAEINRKKMNYLVNKGMLKIRSSPYMYQLRELYAA